MGTIIADRSHFTAFHRDVVRCQATVMLTGFPSLILLFSSCSENAALILISGCVTNRLREVRCPSPGIASPGSFGGRSALLIPVRVALLLPSGDETVPACAFPVSGKNPVAEAPETSFPL